MCGIAGLLAPANRLEPAVIERMIAAQHHRGPDDRGAERFAAGDHECWLGSTRLAVIDLSSAGHMPMRDAASGNALVYNGEVYNFMDLRRELEGRGETFVSRTDTEVVLKLLRLQGLRCLSRLRGMFALALWDARARELLLARDRAGKKPLYFASFDGGFAVASEVRALLASGLVERRLDREGLEVYLANGFMVAPVTPIRGVRSLLPGHWMRVSCDGRVLDEGCYWHPPGPRARVGPAELQATEAAFTEAVGLRRISDVPLGAFLSGGVDSSAVVAGMRRAGSEVRTFSIAFREPGFDESAYARRVAEGFGTRHIEVAIGESDLRGSLEGHLGALDQPSFDGLNTYLVARAAKQGGLTVAVSGIGADEFFGGYPFFRTVPAMSRLAGFLPRWGTARPPATAVAGALKLVELRRTRRGRDGHALGAYQVAQTLFPSWTRDALLAEPPDPASTDERIGLPEEFRRFVRREIEGLDPLSALSVLTWRLFLGERCLRDTDSVSMAVSLEVRAPFVDHVFVERLLQIPAAVRCAGAPDKPFEWELFGALLGDVVPRRRKQGFVVPAEKWLRQASLRPLVADTLGDERLVRSLGLRPASVADLWRAFEAGSVPWSRAWALFVLAEWCRRQRVTL